MYNLDFYFSGEASSAVIYSWKVLVVFSLNKVRNREKVNYTLKVIAISK